MARAPVRPPHEDEQALFREAVADVRKISFDRVHHEPPRPTPIPLQHLRDEASALAESLNDPPGLDLHLECGDEVSFLRAGLARSVLRDLRRGRWVVQDQLDLHCCTREQARQMVASFLAGALRRGLRCLRIIHGKGHRSPGREPVLKRLVYGWLTQRQEILAYCQARTTDGGAGAVVLLLRAPR